MADGTDAVKVSLKKIKDCKIQLSVEIEAERVEARFQEILRNFQRQARLPGFREGKAPADLVEKRFAKEAREETLKSLIPEAYHQSLHSKKVSAVSLPKISGIEYARGQKLSFSAEFEEAPAVLIKNYKGVSLKRESAEVSQSEVEKGLQSLLDSKAEIGKPQPALDEEFAKIFGHESVELLRDAVRKDLVTYGHSQSMEKMKSELFEKLLGMALLTAPESLVKKQKERLVSDARRRYQEMRVSPDEWQKESVRIEAEADARAQEQVKLYFILQKIADLEKIEIDELELHQRLLTIAEQSKRPIEEVRQMFEEDLRESTCEKKTVDYLIANAKFEEEHQLKM